MHLPQSDKFYLEQATANGIDPEKQCCPRMAYYLSSPTFTPHMGPCRVLNWIASWNQYLIPVAHDGYSSIVIEFCPWCGRKLPESKEKLWYQTLHSLGFMDPGNEEIPEKFNSDEWWRELE